MNATKTKITKLSCLTINMSEQKRNKNHGEIDLLPSHPASSIFLLTLPGVEHRHPVLHAQPVHDDHLCGGAGDRPSLAPGDAAGRGMAAGEPLGYYSKYKQFKVSIECFSFNSTR